MKKKLMEEPISGAPEVLEAPGAAGEATVPGDDLSASGSNGVEHEGIDSTAVDPIEPARAGQMKTAENGAFRDENDTEALAGSATDPGDGSAEPDDAAEAEVQRETEGASEESQDSESDRIAERILQEARREALQVQISEVKEKHERLKEDFEKFISRSREQQDLGVQRARANILEASLDVYDDLDRWLQAAPQQSHEAPALEPLMQGATLVCDSLNALVQRFVPEESLPLEEAGITEMAEIVQEPDSPSDASRPLEEELEMEQGHLSDTAARYRAYKRRVKTQLEREKAQATEAVLVALQRVWDVFNEGLVALRADEEEKAVDTVYASLKAVMDQTAENFSKVYAEFEVTLMDVVGHPFEVDHHEAVGQAPSPEQPSGAVLYEVRRGYMIDDQVLRYAQVIVAV